MKEILPGDGNELHSMRRGKMMMESHLKIALSICVVAILALVWVNYVDLGGSSEEHPNPKVNDGLTSLTGFDVAYPETGTSAKGTVFVMQGSDSLHVKIVMDFVRGETDTGGAGFYFTPELKVTDVLCSFNGDIYSWAHIEIVDLGIKGGGTIMWIGWDPFGQQTDPGQGTAIIDLQLSGYAALDEIDSLRFDVGTGRNGAVYGAHESVTIPLRHSNTA